MTIDFASRILIEFRERYPETHSLKKFREFIQGYGWEQQRMLIDLFIASEVRRTQ